MDQHKKRKEFVKKRNELKSHQNAVSINMQSIERRPQKEREIFPNIVHY